VTAAEIEAVKRRIDADRERHIRDLYALLSIPSITREREGIESCVSALAARLEQAGFRAQALPTSGNPVVVGRHPGTGRGRRPLIYGHYDVQPADPAASWTTPPFVPALRNGRIYARGAGDNKGQLLAHVLAVETLQKLGIPFPPVTLLVEGEEETGSRSLGPFVTANRDLLAADVFFGADGPRHESNRPTIYLGCRGLLAVDVALRGAPRDLHSGHWGGVAVSGAWRMIDLLSSLRSPDGRVLIAGFEDGIPEPTSDELRLIQSLPFDPARGADLAGGHVGSAIEHHVALMFRPTLSLNGVSTGYSGPGPKTVIPARANAKLDMRLVAPQTPDDMLALLERHLADHGFADADVTPLFAMPPARTPLDHPFVCLVRDAIAAASGAEPVILPAIGGTIPQHVFQHELGLPCIWSAYANWDQANHAPNENIEVACYLEGIAQSAFLLAALADD